MPLKRYKTSFSEEENAYRIHNVPVFASIYRDDSEAYDEEWILSAVQEAQARQKDGNLPTLYVEHDNDAESLDNPRREIAGFVENQRAVPMEFDGKKQHVIYADLVITSPEIFEEIAHEQLPGISAEISKSQDNYPQAISSFALLNSEPPAIKLPPILIEKKEPIHKASSALFSLFSEITEERTVVFTYPSKIDTFSEKTSCFSVRFAEEESKGKRVIQTVVVPKETAGTDEDARKIASRYGSPSLTRENERSRRYRFVSPREVKKGSYRTRKTPSGVAVVTAERQKTLDAARPKEAKDVDGFAEEPTREQMHRRRSGYNPRVSSTRKNKKYPLSPGTPLRRFFKSKAGNWVDEVSIFKNVLSDGTLIFEDALVSVPGLDPGDKPEPVLIKARLDFLSDDILDYQVKGVDGEDYPSIKAWVDEQMKEYASTLGPEYFSEEQEQDIEQVLQRELEESSDLGETLQNWGQSQRILERMRKLFSQVMSLAEKYPEGRMLGNRLENDIQIFFEFPEDSAFETTTELIEAYEPNGPRWKAVKPAMTEGDTEQLFYLYQKILDANATLANVFVSEEELDNKLSQVNASLESAFPALKSLKDKDVFAESVEELRVKAKRDPEARERLERELKRLGYEKSTEEILDALVNNFVKLVQLDGLVSEFVSQDSSEAKDAYQKYNVALKEREKLLREIEEKTGGTAIKSTGEQKGSISKITGLVPRKKLERMAKVATGKGEASKHRFTVEHLLNPNTKPSFFDHFKETPMGPMKKGMKGKSRLQEANSSEKDKYMNKFAEGEGEAVEEIKEEVMDLPGHLQPLVMILAELSEEQIADIMEYVKSVASQEEGEAEMMEYSEKEEGVLSGSAYEKKRKPMENSAAKFSERPPAWFSDFATEMRGQINELQNEVYSQKSRSTEEDLRGRMSRTLRKLPGRAKAQQKVLHTFSEKGEEAAVAVLEAYEDTVSTLPPAMDRREAGGSSQSVLNEEDKKILEPFAGNPAHFREAKEFLDLHQNTRTQKDKASFVELNMKAKHAEYRNKNVTFKHNKGV